LVAACTSQGAVPPYEIAFPAQVALSQGELD
jgi:hypothetical protein